jgi:hypothetical protein
LGVGHPDLAIIRINEAALASLRKIKLRTQINGTCNGRTIADENEQKNHFRTFIQGLKTYNTFIHGRRPGSSYF